MLSEIFIALCAISASWSQSFDSPPLDWVDKDESGAYQFGYATGDEGKHYHVSSATANNQVSGRFGYKDPVTGGDLQTVYTAGRKGFRARGPHIARRMDLSQNRPPFARPNNDGKYIPELDNVFDPNEDRGYDFSYRTPTQIKEEHADRVGDVQGRYSYVDDVGNRHTVEYIAGSGTGFVVTNAVPDTFARARGGPLYFVGNRPGPKIRGFHAIQKALDGSYRFEASGPDHKRSEVSDAAGNRRGTYTYLDDKGIQHTVEYIAGPNIGYKIINNKKGTAYNPILPFFPDSSTFGPFSPSFPTTTLRPIGSSGFGGSGSPGTSSFPLKPTDTTKIPGGGGSTSSFPGHQGGPGFPGGSSGSTFGGGSSGSGSSFGGSPSSSKPGFPGGSSGSTFGGGSSGSGSSFGGSPSSSKPGFGGGSSGSGSAFGDGSSGLGSSFGGSPSISRPGFGGGSSESGSSFGGPTTSHPGDLPDSSYGHSPTPLPDTGSSAGTDGTKFQTPGPTKPTTSFPSSSRPDYSSGPDQKWNYNSDHGVNNPVYPHSKDWSMHTKPESGKKPRPGIPANFPFFTPTYPGPFGPFYEDGINTAESGHGLKHPDCGVNGTKGEGGYFTPHAPKHYRGSIKFGGVRRNGEDKEKREFLEIPPGVAVRAHVQSLDIVPLRKRFASPSEALETFSKNKDER